MNANVSLIPLVEANPVIVLTDSEKFNRFYAEMKRETDAFVPDLSTATGRKAIAALAYKVARTKTAIDDAGKRLNEERRAEINKVDEARREIREKLDALKDEVRKPLTAWEEREKERVAQVDAFFERIKAAQVVTMEDTPETIGARLAEIAALEIDEAEFAESHAVAVQLRDNAVQALRSAEARLVKEAADRAELERLRAEAAEREERERVAKEEAEAKALAEAAEKAAADRAARLAAEEQERIASAAREAEERARAAAEAQAREAAAAQQRAHDEALAAEKRRADEAEAARKAEADRIAREEAGRAAEAKRVADEQARREADQAHRGRIMGEAKAAIMSHGIGETAAKAVVLAIKAGEIPHVSIKF